MGEINFKNQKEIILELRRTTGGVAKLISKSAYLFIHGKSYAIALNAMQIQNTQIECKCECKCDCKILYLFENYMLTNGGESRKSGFY